MKKRIAVLIREKIENGFNCFLKGMAIGIDSYAAEIVISLKKEFPNISLYDIVPCANQSCKWNDAQVSRYNSILKQCDNIIVFARCSHFRLYAKAQSLYGRTFKVRYRDMERYG